MDVQAEINKIFFFQFWSLLNQDLSLIKTLSIPIHLTELISMTVNTPRSNQFHVTVEKYIPRKNMFWRMNLEKMRGVRSFEIAHWPVKLQLTSIGCLACLTGFDGIFNLAFISTMYNFQTYFSLILLCFLIVKNTFFQEHIFP